MTNETRFSRLAELAHERSSDKRRELLREVTDLFFDRNGKRSLDEDRLFDDIMSSVAAEMDFEVRVELANRLTKSPGGPRRDCRGNWRWTISRWLNPYCAPARRWRMRIWSILPASRGRII